LIWRGPDSHRFFIGGRLVARPLNRIPRTGKERAVLDIILVGLALALFALSVGYAYACDRL